MNRKKSSAVDFLSFYIAEQGFESTPPLDVPASIREELERVGLLDDVKPGHTVLLTAGSRGIESMVHVLAALSREIKKRGAKPLILPAMGSHGGGTAQGQIEVLRHLGQTEATLGATIHDQLESVHVGDTEKFPVVADRAAINSDHIILVNRVKEHTEFIGKIESGLLKMAVVGLGRTAGAEAMHQLAVKRTYQRAIIDIARVLCEKLPVRGGIAILEDKNNIVRRIEAIPAANIFEREPLLLKEAHKYHAYLPFDDLDVLLVDEIGKEISGAGFDTKVIGRIMNIYEKECEKPRITRIALRDLSKITGGNALGLGLADFVNKRVVDKMDPAMTALNAITACAPEKGRVPIWFNSDRKMLDAAFQSIGPWNPDSVRAAWIINTADLKELAISPVLVGEARSRGLKVSKDSFRLPFNAKGNLIGLRKVLAERGARK
jgi:hypothetical protein